jgi:Chaperone of endosialidase
MKNRNPAFAAILFVFALLCAAVAPKAFAVVPAPDGGYPGFNTAEGQNALQNLTTGAANTGIGWYSLFSATTGSFNTGLGAGALALNTADENTAIGTATLLFNTADGNTAVGSRALLNNTTGGTLDVIIDQFSVGPNVAIGQRALESNTLGGGSVAVGYQALASFVQGPIIPNPPNPDVDMRALALNTAVGFQALANATGPFNTAFGYRALYNTTGGFNGTFFEGAQNVAIGTQALANNETGSNNIALGYLAGDNVTTANSVICIGVSGEDVDNTTWIGRIYGTTTISGSTQQVVVTPGGQLGTVGSSRRFKKDIEPMNNASEAILALKPVKFRYKTDKTHTSQFGLIAENVAEIDPDLVTYGQDGEIYSVRYDAVNAMLLNEFLKEHRKNEKQEATIAELKTEIASLSATVKEQAVQIQKVSAQLEVSKGAPEIAVNDQ